jgi:hypothetical protein
MFSSERERKKGMKNPRKTANGLGAKIPMNDCQPYSSRIREVLSGTPNIRWEKVSIMQRLMASEEWPPRDDTLVERMLFEHLLDPL